jgi:hypothetical protein
MCTVLLPPGVNQIAVKVSKNNKNETGYKRLGHFNSHFAGRKTIKSLSGQ